MQGLDAGGFEVEGGGLNHRREGAEGDERVLRPLVDPEPDHEQWKKRDLRDRKDGRDQGHQPGPDVEKEPDEDAGTDADAHAERDACGQPTQRAATSPAQPSRTNASRSMTAGRLCIDSSTPSMMGPLVSCSTPSNSCGTSVCRTPSGTSIDGLYYLFRSAPRCRRSVSGVRGAEGGVPGPHGEIGPSGDAVDYVSIRWSPMSWLLANCSGCAESES